MKNYILAIAVLLSGMATSCNKDAEGAVYAESEMAFSFVNSKQVMETGTEKYRNSESAGLSFQQKR